MLLPALKVLIQLMLFTLAIWVENARQPRLWIMLALFFFYLGLGLGRFLMFKNSKNQKDQSLYSWSFLADIILVYSLENHSRFLINYLFHSFYILILLEAVLTLGRRQGTMIGLITVIASLIKFATLIFYQFNLTNGSQAAFFLLVNLLILVIANFAQYNKEEKEKKDLLYQELLDIYKRLKQSSNEVQRLTIVEERNRIARDLHDSIGHNMTALIMLLEMAGPTITEDLNQGKRYLEQAKATARDSLAGIREVVATLRGKNSTGETLPDLINDFAQKTGIEIGLDISGSTETQEPSLNYALLRIVQEALTNSVRHAKATRVEITLKYHGKMVEFMIKDNGAVSNEWAEGYGLMGIRERAAELNGEVSFGSDNGFVVKGRLDPEGKHDQSTDCR